MILILEEFRFLGKEGSPDIVRIVTKFLVNWLFRNSNTNYDFGKGRSMNNMKVVEGAVASVGKPPVDNIDIQMIDILRKNGRMTNVELAERVGLSPPPCLRRLRFLEDENVILGYEAKVNHKKLGYEVSAIIIVRFDTPKLKIISKFKSEIEKLPVVLNVKQTLDTSDLIISLVSKDLESYGKFIKDFIQENDNIASFNSYILDAPR